MKRLVFWHAVWRASRGRVPLPVTTFLRRRYELAVARVALDRVIREERERTSKLHIYEGTEPTEHDIAAARALRDFKLNPDAWACLAGDGPACDPSADGDMIADLHDAEAWRASPPRREWIA